MNPLIVKSRQSSVVGPVFCPKCGYEMDRIIRRPVDKWPTFVSFGWIRVKRYLCMGCFWEKTRTGL